MKGWHQRPVERYLWDVISGEMNGHPALLIANSTYYGCITQVIILCDGSCHSCSWSLLGKLISKLEDPWILLEHLGNFHLYGCSQLLSLIAGVDTYREWPRRKRKQLLAWERCMAIFWIKRQKSQIEREKITWGIFSHTVIWELFLEKQNPTDSWICWHVKLKRLSKLFMKEKTIPDVKLKQN